MKLLHTLTITALFSFCAFTSVANANTNNQVNENSAIYKIVSRAVHETVAQAEYELNLQVQKTILTISNEFSFDESPTPANKVTITDLLAKNENSEKRAKAINEESENSDRTE